MLTGSCLCGAVAFEADPPTNSPITFCNCRSCKKAHGTAFAAVMPVPRAAFRWVRGEATLRDYESSPGKLRRFCSRCGSHMTAERPNDPAASIRIRLGTLDTPVENPRVVGHIWRSQGANWFDPARTVAQYPEFVPPEALAR